MNLTPAERFELEDMEKDLNEAQTKRKSHGKLKGKRRQDLN